MQFVKKTDLTTQSTSNLSWFALITGFSVSSLKCLNYRFFHSHSVRSQSICSLFLIASIALLAATITGCSNNQEDNAIAKKKATDTSPKKQPKSKKHTTTSKNKNHKSHKKPEKKPLNKLDAIKKIVEEAEKEGFPHLDSGDNRPGERFITEIDLKALAASGIARLQGKHITIYTDARLTNAIQELPKVFDQAVPQWCRYFAIDPNKMDRWHVNVFLMSDQSIFGRHHLLTAAVPDKLLAGYANQRELYLMEPANRTDYYRRHLLLHEGTHAFMYTALGGTGAPWYMEGMAEYFGTHHWDKDKKTLTMRYLPKSKKELPGWGRIQLIQQDLKKHRKEIANILTIIMQRQMPANNQKTDNYAWCWMLVYFLDNHPDFQKQFKLLVKHCQKSHSDFNDSVGKIYQNNKDQVSELWQLYADQLVPGYDLNTMKFDFSAATKTVDTIASMKIKAKENWQNSGLRLVAGNTYKITASGRFVVVKSNLIKNKTTWHCEPGGVTIEYYNGRPLGMLMAVVRPDSFNPKHESAFLYPQTIGLEANFTAINSGTLFLKVNDSPAKRHDNSGSISVKIQKN